MMIRLGRKRDLHGAAFSTLIAARALMRINVQADKAYSIKKAVKSTQGAKVFAKKAVDEQSAGKDDQEQEEFPAK